MAEDMHELPISEIPGAYIIRKPKRPLLEVSAFPRGYEVRFDTDAIMEYAGEAQNYEIERRLFRKIAEAYGWNVSDSWNVSDRK